MNKISIKIGLLFFLIIFTMEICLFFFLHQKIAHIRIDEELASLVNRGNNHRDVLETYYNQETIHHIALMEAKSITEVVITNEHGELIIASTEMTNALRRFLVGEKESVPRDGEVIEDDWRSQPYIASVTPFKKGADKGYVYMFKDTSQVRALISQLNRHFLFAGIATVSVTALIIWILSRIVARPLIQMKVATKKLSEGNFSIQLKTTSRDELGELARSIQWLATELNHLKNERNEFLASMSHELRTPLTYIKGYADIAKREQLGHEDRLHYLDIITEETDKVSNLVAELMELAKLDHNNFSIQKEWFSLHQALGKISEKLAPAFQQAQMQLLVDCPVDILIFADPVRLNQMIINLLDNAKKYSKPGSFTKVAVQRNGHDIIIAIEDQGKGIPPLDLPFIFERLYRVDKSRSREFGGTGLGLSIVKQLAEAHGWKVKAASELGVGSIFTIIARGKGS